MEAKWNTSCSEVHVPVASINGHMLPMAGRIDWLRWWAKAASSIIALNQVVPCGSSAMINFYELFGEQPPPRDIAWSNYYYDRQRSLWLVRGTEHQQSHDLEEPETMRELHLEAGTSLFSYVLHGSASRNRPVPELSATVMNLPAQVLRPVASEAKRCVLELLRAIDVGLLGALTAALIGHHHARPRFAQPPEA